MQGKCDKSELESGMHYEIVGIEIKDGVGKEIGTCKFCGLRREYRVLDWTELYNKFNLDKPPKISTLTWGTQSKRERRLRGSMIGG